MLTLSILFLMNVAVGGLGNVYGALVGSATIVLLTEFLKRLSTRPDLPARAACFPASSTSSARSSPAAQASR